MEILVGIFVQGIIFLLSLFKKEQDPKDDETIQPFFLFDDIDDDTNDSDFGD